MFDPLSLKLKLMWFSKDVYEMPMYCFLLQNVSRIAELRFLRFSEYVAIVFNFVDW